MHWLYVHSTSGRTPFPKKMTIFDAIQRGPRVPGEQESVEEDFSLHTVLYLLNFEPYEWFKILKFLFILKIVNKIELLRVQC